MRKLFVLPLLLAGSLAAYSQTSGLMTFGANRLKNDGWTVGIAPVVTYNSDLGAQLGGVVELCDYDEGSLYTQRINLAASYCTRNQVMVDFFYDSYKLIRGLYFTARIGYQTHPLRSFYGFNGVEDYYQDWDRNRDGRVAYYSMQNSTLRAQMALRGSITPSLGWTGGINYMNVKTGNLQLGDYDAGNTLFNRYVSSGIISPEEKDGGSVLELKGGLQYDSRDHQLSPRSGIHTDFLLTAGQEFGSAQNTYFKLGAHFRHYITPGKDWLTFAYHLAYQGTVAGSSPFYMLQDVYSYDSSQSLNEGLGGDNTIRGMLSRRLLASGYAWANIEARFRFVSWEDGSQSMSIGANPFCDLGILTQTYRLESMASATHTDVGTLRDKASKPQVSVGAGLNFITNGNMISFVFAKSLTMPERSFEFSIVASYAF